MKNSRYETHELVMLGDKIHNSSASIIITQNDLDSEDIGKELMFSSHGKRSDIVNMMVEVCKENPQFENLLMEVIARYNIRKHKIKEDDSDC